MSLQPVSEGQERIAELNGQIDWLTQKVGACLVRAEAAEGRIKALADQADRLADGAEWNGGMSYPPTVVIRRLRKALRELSAEARDGGPGQ